MAGFSLWRHFRGLGKLMPLTALMLVFFLFMGSVSLGFSQGVQQGDDNPQPKKRSFYMGFQPWNYSWEEDKLENVYNLLHKHGDIVSHHIDNGIPWPEALENKPYHPKIEKELKERVANTNREKLKVFLSTSPINNSRKNIAEYWGDGAAKPLPKGWKNIKFSDERAVKAYINYCRRMIEAFQPDYYAYGVEVSMLAKHDPEVFKAFVPFVQKVYTTLKAENPDLPLFMSFYIEHPDDLASYKKTIEPLLPYTDIYAVSTYPYNKDLPPVAQLPKNWFRQIREIAPDKPFAVAETSFIAEPFEAFGDTIHSTPYEQAVYTEFLLKEAQALDAEFVIWFSIADYDQLWAVWQWLFLFNPIYRAWKDTGLLDGDLNPRPALSIWEKWLHRPVVTGSNAHSP